MFLSSKYNLVCVIEDESRFNVDHATSPKEAGVSDSIGLVSLQ